MAKKTAKDVLTKEEAKAMVMADKEGMVHTFYNMPFGLIGGDHSKVSVYADIDKAFMVKKAGQQAQAMGHGLVVIPAKECKHSDLLFVETKDEYNHEFDTKK